MNAELEYGIIGDFMNSRPEDMYKLIGIYDLKAEYFHDHDARRAFEKILSLKTRDRVLIRREVWDLIGETSASKAINNANNTGSILDIEERIRRVVNSAKKDEIAAITNQVLVNSRGDETSAAFACDELINKLNTFKSSIGAADDFPKPIRLSEISPSDESDWLFADGWIRKGHPFCLTSVTGSGKSVMTMQLCYSWAVGEAMFDIKPLKPLKIAIFQTEDDNDEIIFFRQAMHYNYKLRYNWTDEKLAKAENNIQFLPMNGEVGDKFLDYLKHILETHDFDLVVINPLQGVTGFDISNNEKASEFFREKVDRIIKDKEHGCALMFVHHTNKISSNANNRVSYDKDPFAQYTGAGASDISNWMRASLLIMPDTKTKKYQLIAPKRGERLTAWKRREGQPNPMKFIKHSDDGAHNPFWLEFDPDTEKSEAQKAKKAEAAETEAELMEKRCQDLADNITELINGTNLRKKSQNLFGRKLGDKTYNHFVENPHKYGIIYEKKGSNNAKIYGTRYLFEQA